MVCCVNLSRIENGTTKKRRRGSGSLVLSVGLSQLSWGLNNEI